MTSNGPLRSFTAFLFVASMMWNGCHGHKNMRRAEALDLQALADEILGVDNSIELNTSKTFALCFQTPTSDHARRKYRYIVVGRLPHLSLVHEGVFSMGSVKWADDDSIEVISSSTSAQEGSMKKIIHVTSTVQ